MIKNVVLITITSVAFMVFLLSGCLLDSSSWLPFICLLISGAWLFLFAYANGYME